MRTMRNNAGKSFAFKDLFGRKKDTNYRRFDARVIAAIGGPAVNFVAGERSGRGGTADDFEGLLQMGVKAGAAELRRPLTGEELSRVEAHVMSRIEDARKL